MDERGEVVGAEEQEAESFVWAGQSRPFRVRLGEPVRAASVRLSALTDGDWAQVEYVREDPGDGAHCGATTAYP